MKMLAVAVIGANGYVGSAICAALATLKNIALTQVIRENYQDTRGHDFDVVINSAMPSGRFWAQSNPDKDFEESVRKTANLVYGWRYRKFVQISSLSARCQLETVYGRHKAAAERICEFRDNLIVRLGPMYSPGLKKGVLIDLLEGRTVYVAAESRYCFAPLDFVAEWIAKNMGRSGIVEVGARNAVSLQEVAARIGAKVQFTGPVDHQEVAGAADGYPDVSGVFDFLDAARRAGGAVRN
jgi:nucleoside-diphosphate-sugar epimerase